MTERRFLAGPKDGGHPPPFAGQLWSADCVDAREDDVETAGLDSVPDRISRKPCIEELGQRDHAVLQADEPPDHLLNVCGAYSPRMRSTD
jgi:hypothetical protein